MSSLKHIFHRLSKSDWDFIKNLPLFNELSDAQQQDVKKYASYVKFNKNTILFSDKQQFDGLYVLLKGSIHISTYDIEGGIVTLAVLKPGGYFGEGAFIGLTHKTKNVCVETIEASAFAKIDLKTIKNSTELQKDTKLKLNLAKFIFGQSISPFTLRILRELKQFLHDAKSIKVFYQNEIIFNVGDIPDNVYILLHGEVKLTIPEKNSSNVRAIILHDGGLFGEVAVIHELARGATATAYLPSTLLVIPGKEFKEIYERDLSIQRLLRELNQTYYLYQFNHIDQYPQGTSKSNVSIKNIIQLANGEKITSERFFDQDKFCMNIENAHTEQEHLFLGENENYIKIFVTNHRLVRVETFGQWKCLPNVCRMIIEKVKVDNEMIKTFLILGELSYSSLSEGYICTCMSVARSIVADLVKQGVKTFAELSIKTGVGTVCGSCQYRVYELLGDEVWEDAEMELATLHNNHIASFYIKPIHHEIKPYFPGQHIILQKNIDGQIINRNYTISNIFEKSTSMRISIKKREGGIFSQWLFEQNLENIQIKTTVPQGNFIISQNPDAPAVFFAGGIGITPFIAYLQLLLAKKINKKILLIYSAHVQEDFVFVEEIQEIANIIPYLDVVFRETAVQGRLTAEEIIAFVHYFESPDVYICAPESFEIFIQNNLIKVGFNQNKIFIEKFYLS